MTDDETVDLHEVQTIGLRQSTGSIVARASEAFKEAGLTEGSYRFKPETLDELGMVLAIGTEEHIDGRTDPLARSIHREGQAETVSITVPPKVLEALGVDAGGIDWEDPPKLTVWAGDRALGFEPARERTVPIGQFVSDSERDV